MLSGKPLQSFPSLLYLKERNSFYHRVQYIMTQGTNLTCFVYFASVVYLYFLLKKTMKNIRPENPENGEPLFMVLAWGAINQSDESFKIAISFALRLLLFMHYAFKDTVLMLCRYVYLKGLKILLHCQNNI